MLGSFFAVVVSGSIYRQVCCFGLSVLPLAADWLIMKVKLVKIGEIRSKTHWKLLFRNLGFAIPCRTSPTSSQTPMAPFK
jgi:hypothetical protein